MIDWSTCVLLLGRSDGDVNRWASGLSVSRRDTASRDGSGRTSATSHWREVPSHLTGDHAGSTNVRLRRRRRSVYFITLDNGQLSSRVYCCPHGSDGLYCFRRIFFCVSTITHDLLNWAWWKFWRNKYLYNRTKPRAFQGHWSRSQDHISRLRDGAKSLLAW